MWNERESKQYDSPAERLLAKFILSNTGCWLWSGSTTPGGYGRIVAGGRKRYAHRVSYELAYGPIQEGLQIDHLCRVTICINPEHMEAVTNRENVLRGNTFAAHNVAKTHCPLGHAYDEANTTRDNGKRKCRTCLRKRSREYNGCATKIIVPTKTHCLLGHAYDDANTYWNRGSRYCRSCRRRRNSRRWRTTVEYVRTHPEPGAGRSAT